MRHGLLKDQDPRIFPGKIYNGYPLVIDMGILIVDGAGMSITYSTSLIIVS